MGTCEYPKCRKAGKTDHTYKAFSAVLLNMKFWNRSSVTQVPASPDSACHPDSESCSLGITAGTVGSTPVPSKQGAAVQGCSKQLLLPSSRGDKVDKALGSEPLTGPVGTGVAAPAQTCPRDSFGKSSRGSILGTDCLPAGLWWPIAQTAVNQQPHPGIFKPNGKLQRKNTTDSKKTLLMYGYSVNKPKRHHRCKEIGRSCLILTLLLIYRAAGAAVLNLHLHFMSVSTH